MSKNKNIGIIGAGMIAEKHIQAFQQTGKANITWLAELKDDLLEEITNKYNIPNGTKDYHDMLADSNVDAIIICTPPKSHRPIFSDVLKAQKHVLLEKPLGMTPEEVDEIVKERQNYPNLIVSGASGRHARLHPKYRLVKEIIDSGKLGDIYFIHHNALARQSRGGIEYHPTAKWFLNKEIAGGGPLFDWGVYDLSFHLGILSDKPELEKIYTAFTKSGLDKVDPGADIFDVEEHFMTTLEFSGDIKFYWERASHVNVEEQNQTRIYGTKGGLKFGFCSWDPEFVEFFDVENEGRGKARSEVIKVNMDNHGGDDYELAKHFLEVLEGKDKPIMPVELAQKHLNIIFDVYKAAE